MDRKSIIILVVSFALLVLWFPLINKIYPPKIVPRTNVQAHATGSLAQATSAFPVRTTDGTSPIPPVPVTPSAPEQILVLTKA